MFLRRRVLIYDSLNSRGHVSYANALTADNAALFDACDGIFLNYWWNPGKEERPGPLLASRAKAAARRWDVYAGVDVFARDRHKLHYDAGPGCADGVDQAATAGLSVALFAPGWTLERGGARGGAAEAAEAEFWGQLAEPVRRLKDAG